MYQRPTTFQTSIDRWKSRSWISLKWFRDVAKEPQRNRNFNFHHYFTSRLKTLQSQCQSCYSDLVFWPPPGKFCIYLLSKNKVFLISSISLFSKWHRWGLVIRKSVKTDFAELVFNRRGLFVTVFLSKRVFHHF